MTSPLPAFLKPLTVPASWLYGSAIKVRNARFDRGLKVQSIDRPVISVGNITTGGTGKTPIVAWIARALMEERFEPVIAMRGYGSTPDQISDEHAEYKTMLPDPLIVANPDRATALREFLPSHPEVKCIILDDGFQHRQIKRALDLVLVDATANTFADRLLPAGNLREPLDNLARADAVILTHAANADERITSLVERFHRKPPLAKSRHAWTQLRVHDGPRTWKPQGTDWLRGKRVLTMLGVGKPQSIIDQLSDLGANVAVNIPCDDHERYTRAKLAVARGLCQGCQAMVVTEKDWVKLRNLLDLGASKWPVPIVVPQLAIEFLEGENLLRQRILDTVRSHPHHPPNNP
ncbi:MAG: tetraacyldisaccharide 4'-kinase [Phycisphaerales bacterium]|nr:tetraacyldisaccharide 4'-kinase [Phycisphaerales bacterium]